MMQAALDTLRHYLDRAEALIGAADDAALFHRPAPGMFIAAGQFATAIGMTGRDLLPAAGHKAPARPDELNRQTLVAYAQDMRAALAGIAPADLTGKTIAHQAGFAALEQGIEEYLLRFALPNMSFHLTAGYIALKQAGTALGKADFDGLHAYPDGFSWE
ncbi:MAG: DUF1993 family protein [Maritimibacter sp.]